MKKNKAITNRESIAARLGKTIGLNLNSDSKDSLIGTTLTADRSRKQSMRKRHWFAGTTVILIGCWITHTTTATIASPEAGKPNVDFESTQLNAGETGLNEAPLAGTQTTLAAQDNHQDKNSTESSLPAEPEISYRSESHTVKRGETLGSIFKKRGYDLAIPHSISQTDIANDLVSLSIGKELIFDFDANDTSDRLLRVRYEQSALNELVVELDGNVVSKAEVIDLPHDIREREVSGVITSSLYDAALEAGLSTSVIMEMVRIFGWDIDFVQDIRKGDSFALVFEEFVRDGNRLLDGNILAAEFVTQGTSYRAIRFENDDGEVSYYAPNGESMLGTFLRSPVEFSRISSRFGKRKHPILKTWRAHKGVDYAASRGTPIRATADGKVVLAGTKGGYGRTVVLRHAGRFSTLYAHMNGFAKGIRSGARVKQGQTIGYVGSTGMATGPHLHYEFRVDGAHRNPLSYKTPKASAVSEHQQAQFQAVASNWLPRLDKLHSGILLAQGATNTNASGE